MARVAYVNGRFVPLSEASVSVQDRGLLFADAIYEVWRVAGGRLRDREGHFARLARSLGELRIAPPMGRAALEIALNELVRRNRLRDGLVYLQITRGAAPRDHVFPDPPVPPTLIAFTRALDMAAMQAKALTGLRVATRPDLRWGRCDIKTTGLLPNVLAKQEARDAGAGDAWLVGADGLVTEAASANVWIVADGRLVTTQLTSAILPGVTRGRVIDLARDRQIAVEERSFRVAEAQAADEAFVTSASGMVIPVIEIDGVPVGDGAPGRITRMLQDAYRRLED